MMSNVFINASKSASFALILTLVLITTGLLTSPLQAEPLPQTESANNFKQNNLSCAIITSEHLTILQLYQRGLPKDVAIKSLPNISRQAKKRVDYVYTLADKIGILNAYSDINTNFARCSTLVFQVKGKPAPDLKEHAYYFCSGENKVRFELILKLDQRMSVDAIADTLPTRYLHIINSYQRLINAKGLLSAFDLTANNLKSCLQQIE